MTNLEALRAYVSSGGPPTGWHITLGARLTEVDAGRVVVELDAGPDHLHEWGLVQGGIITSIADAAMGLSVLTVQPEGEVNLTAELKINFLRGVRSGRTRAVGTVIRADPHLLFSSAEVFDAQGRLVAMATSTLLPVPGGIPGAAL